MGEYNRPLPAYNNLEFINSPDARLIRVMCEFLEPMRRFRKMAVRDTIVFFGSARTLTPDVAKNNYRDLQSKIRRQKNPSRSLLQQLEYAKIQLDSSKYYEDAVELAYLLTKWSKTLSDGKRFLICSGGGPGIMEAANRGAKKAGGPSLGLNITLPMEQSPNPFISPELSFDFHYFFVRKFWFAYLAKALIIFPGGFGTLDEFFEMITLIQTKKIEKALPIVIYGTEYWKEVINFDTMLRHQMISPEDMNLIQFADTPEFAFDFLKKELTKHYL
jgi:hypothetical protein